MQAKSFTGIPEKSIEIGDLRYQGTDSYPAVFSIIFLTNFALRILAKLSQVPVICSYEQNVYVNRTGLQILADKILSYFTDVIFPVSREVLDFTSKQERIPKSKFKLNYNAVPLETQELSEPEKQEFKKDFSIKNILREKYRAVEEKLRTKKKLTTEDLIVFQGKEE